LDTLLWVIYATNFGTANRCRVKPSSFLFFLQQHIGDKMRAKFWAISFLVFGMTVGCIGDSEFGSLVDLDGDGYLPIGVGGDDCDNEDPAVHPNADELCGDGIDNNCDGIVDDVGVGAQEWYEDLDGDGFGFASTLACTAPNAYVAKDGDCDDLVSAVNPDALDDQCDGVDNNCNGQTDEWSKFTSWYVDADVDGEGEIGSGELFCAKPTDEAWSLVEGDCDDKNDQVYSQAPEVCDGQDNDCDALIDDEDNDVVGASDWYIDTDGDGVGAEDVSLAMCERPDGYVADAGDCDDTDSGNFSGNTEACDGQDNDCDDLIDDEDKSLDLTTATAFFVDVDGDGYGVPGAVMMACLQPVNMAPNDDDCDDSTSAVNPGELEVCDDANTDENCNGYADDGDKAATGATFWYADGDDDGYGDDGTVGIFGVLSQCDAPDGYVANDEDCDDLEEGVNPAAVESCDPDDVDEDCNGLSEDMDADVLIGSLLSWYADIDGDGFGDAATLSVSCQAPSGAVAEADDCDDAEASINPDASEICDALDVDEDCDALADDADPDVDAATMSAFFQDTDMDGYGDTAVVYQCDLSDSTSLDNTDCDDNSSTTNPSMPEVCGDGANNDCDDTTLCRLEDGTSSYDADATYTGLIDGGALGVSGRIGDVTGDGLDDLCLAAPGALSLYRFYDMLGVYDVDSASKVWDDFSMDFESFGHTLSGGDMDGDGRSELAVGTTPTDEDGAVGLYFFSAGPIVLGGSEDPDVMIFGEDASFGAALTLEGDVTGDDLSDLVIGSRNDRAVFLFTDVAAPPILEGGMSDFLPELTVADADIVISDSTGGFVGLSVASDADVDGDGVDDLFFSEALGVNIFGYSGASMTTVMTEADAEWDYAVDVSLYSGSVENVGDINGDGLSDILVWNMLTDSIAWLSLDPGVGLDAFGEFSGSHPNNGMVEGLDDLDGDGFDDFAVSGGDEGAGGEVYVVYGRPFAPASHLVEDISILVEGIDTGGGFGMIVSSLGDVNGDEYADFVVSAPLVDGVGLASDVGEAYLFLGMGL
jgi:hypothetical protein